MHLHHFKFIRSDFIDELQATMTQYQHPSGLQVVKIHNLDPQNVAAILLQTISESSNGCAHVLEHVVLCGSKKFDVKDPFFSMLRRSLSGFANAFTGSDFTCYPFAAHIKEDFFNLFEVYLDAVFHPLIEKASFLQEGCRNTFEGYKGIVFNEMKQAHSSLYDRFHHKTVEHLFFDTPYRFDSGGEPSEIVRLNHEDLIAFHKKYYHPSKAQIFLYGNLDIDEQLVAIEKSIATIPPLEQGDTPRVYQKPFENKKVIHTNYPAPSNDEGHHMTIGFCLGSHLEEDKLLQAQLMTMLLADNDACVLPRAIMGEGLASSVDVVYDLEVLQPYTYFIFKDVTDSKKLIDKFDEVIRKAHDEGFDEEIILSSLHQLKIHFLNTVEDGYPTGLTLFFRAFLSSLNGSNPLQLLRFKGRMEQLNNWVIERGSISLALSDFFLTNRHRVEIHFDPKENLLQQELPVQEEIDDKMRKKIIEETSLIEQKQQRSSDTSSLPILHMDHLDIKPQTFELKQIQSGIDFHVHTTWTNGLSYVDLFIDLIEFKEEELHYLGFLTHLMSEIGVIGQSFDEVIHEKGAILSSIGFAVQPIKERLVLTCSFDCLSENLDKAFAYAKKILISTKFDERERIEEILKDLISSYKASFTQRGVGKCVLKSKSLLHSGYDAIEKIKGFSFYFWLKALEKRPFEDIQNGLKKVFENLLNSESVLAATIVTDLPDIPEFGLEKTKKQKPMEIGQYKTEKQGLFFTYQVQTHANENAFSFLSFKYEDPECAIARIVVELTKHLQLHPILREIHGAYGTSMSYESTLGLMTMYTSCDPNIELTYKVFLEVLHPIAEGNYTDEELYEAKLSALQKSDGIVPLNQRATTQYILNRTGRTIEERIDHRNRLIHANRSDITKCVDKIISNLTGGVRVSMGGKSALEELKNPPTANVEL